MEFMSAWHFSIVGGLVVLMAIAGGHGTGSMTFPPGCDEENPGLTSCQAPSDPSIFNSTAPFLFSGGVKHDWAPGEWVHPSGGKEPNDDSRSSSQLIMDHPGTVTSFRLFIDRGWCTSGGPVVVYKNEEPTLLSHTWVHTGEDQNLVTTAPVQFLPGDRFSLRNDGSQHICYMSFSLGGFYHTAEQLIP